MLIKLGVSNYKAILDPVEFSLIATSEQQHGERLYPVKKFQKRFLPAAIMFGGNASGKSSFVQAIHFMRSMVLHENTSPLNYLKQNATLPEQEALHSTFEVDLLLDDLIYNYQFSCTRKKIVEERLTKSNSRSEYVLFHRRGEEIDFPDVKMNDVERQRRHFLAESLRDDKLFLYHSIDMKLDDYQAVYDWFEKSLVIIGPQSRFVGSQIYTAERILDLYNKFLPFIDAGIERLELETISREKIEIDDEILKEIRSSAPKGKEFSLLLPFGNNFILMTVKDNGNPEFSRLISIHKNKNAEEFKLPINEESDGTIRTLDLIPAFCTQRLDGRARTYVIDEIDRSLHSLLTRYLYSCFFKRRREGSQDQIIATTHDLDLIDQELFRRDEMWFFERSLRGAQLFSYAEFAEARHDQDLRKIYKEGRIGGLPNLVPSNFVMGG